MNCKKTACGAIITIVVMFIAFFVLHTISMNAMHKTTVTVSTPSYNKIVKESKSKKVYESCLTIPYLIAEKNNDNFKYYWITKNLDNEIIFKAEKNIIIKYINSKNGLNLRISPIIEETNIYKVLNYGEEIKILGISSDGWALAEVDTKRFFCREEYLSDSKPIEKSSSKSSSYTKGQGDASLGIYTLTAYCSCTKCCGKWSGSPTASGTTPTQGRTVACNSLSFGTKISINGNIYTVEDTGNMSDNVIDIYFNSHSEALQFGRQKAEVFLVQ